MDKKSNKSWKVTFNQLETDINTFKDLYEANSKEPYYVAALGVVALSLWPEDKEKAINMLNLLKGPENLSNYDIQFISERLRGKDYLAYSYFEGTSPENGYEPSKPYTINVKTFPSSFDEKGYVKFYLQSSGADSPRPIKVRQKPSSGEWFLWEQMLLSDIRIPVSDDPWA